MKTAKDKGLKYSEINIQYYKICIFCRTREGYCFYALQNSESSNLSVEIKSVITEFNIRVILL